MITDISSVKNLHMSFRRMPTRLKHFIYINPFLFSPSEKLGVPIKKKYTMDTKVA